MSAADTVDRQPELKRVMGPGLLLLFVVGDILGTGVYALTGDVAAEVGGAAWPPFLERTFSSNFFKGFEFSWGTAGVVILALLFMTALALVNLHKR